MVKLFCSFCFASSPLPANAHMRGEIYWTEPTWGSNAACALLACNGAAGSRGGKCVTQMTIKLEIKKINIGKTWPKTLYVLLVKLQKIAIDCASICVTLVN